MGYYYTSQPHRRKPLTISRWTHIGKRNPKPNTQFEYDEYRYTWRTPHVLHSNLLLSAPSKHPSQWVCGEISIDLENVNCAHELIPNTVILSVSICDYSRVKTVGREHIWWCVTFRTIAERRDLDTVRAIRSKEFAPVCNMVNIQCNRSDLGPDNLCK